MTFSKMEIILTLLAVALGMYLTRPNLRRLIGWAALLLLLYVAVLSPFVLFARVAYRAQGVEDVGQLKAAVSEFGATSRDDLAGLVPGVQTWWTRLNYANAQAFAMEDYDTGVGGDTFALLPYTVIPRIVYPDKPIMTTGQEFTLAVTGNWKLSDSTSTGAGAFAEAYGNGGWPTVLAACAYMGLLFGVFARFAMTRIAAGRYIFVPVIMMGIVMGLRPDDWFVPTYVGAAVEAVVWYFGLRHIVLPAVNTRLLTRAAAS
jgi:hypothetical protein